MMVQGSFWRKDGKGKRKSAKSVESGAGEESSVGEESARAFDGSNEHPDKGKRRRKKTAEKVVRNG